MWRRLAIAAAFILLELLALRVLAPIDHRVQDRILRDDALRRAPDPDIVLVNIDERSLSLMNADFGAYPWPRSVYAEFLEKLAPQQPAAVVFDQVFADPVREHTDEDAYFSDTFAATPNTYAAAAWLQGVPAGQGLPLQEQGAALGFIRTPAADPAARLPLLLPFERIARSGRIGLVNRLDDADGVTRRYRAFLDWQGWRVPSLPVRVAQGLGWALPPGAEVELHWRGAAGARPQVSFADLFQDFERSHPQRPPDEFRGKLLVIGVSAVGLGDLHATPLATAQGGPEILAAALETIRHGDRLRRPPRWAALLLGLLPLAALALAHRRGAGLLALGVALLAFSPAALAAAWVAPRLNWLLPLTAPLATLWSAYLALALAEYARERRERAHAVRVFSRFLHPQVVKEVVASQRDLLARPAQSLPITLLFSDIRGFTTYSESRPPEQVVAMLNRYFSRQVAVVFKHGGTVDKFIGDAIMAFWGAPLADPRHAEHAVRAALEMQEVVQAFAAELRQEGVEFDIGIGLHTGAAVVGFIGSQNKTDYTAIGDTVNLASRIEGLTKGVARILVSEQTRAAVGEAIAFADRGEFKAKGREQPVRLYEPLAPAAAAAGVPGNAAHLQPAGDDGGGAGRVEQHA